MRDGSLELCDGEIEEGVYPMMLMLKTKVLLGLEIDSQVSVLQSQPLLLGNTF